jgi:membrane protein YqaA with SNARE-associated domain
MFAKLLEHVLAWSAHPRAPLYLGAVSFAESSFFPIPPDVLLAPMVLSRPERAWRLAAWTTLWSVLGGVAAFTAAAFAVEAVADVLQRNGLWEGYLTAQAWFADWGFWAVLAAGFSPIPYKVFAFAAGGMSMVLPAFVVASIAGRGGRFFLVAALVAWGGSRVELALRRYVERIGWGLVALGVLTYLLIRAV